MSYEKTKNLVFIRGGGDIATGVAQRLFNSGFKVFLMEAKNPSAIRREVSFSEAVYDKKKVVSNIEAVLVNSLEEGISVLNEGKIPLIVDESASILSTIRAEILVDAILAKRNLGTTKDMADIVIGVGPGFCAGVDCHCVVETKRGHHLGEVIYRGSAAPNTGIPGEIGGISKKRVIHSLYEGVLKNHAKIGDVVEKGEIIASVNGFEIKASISGVLRGLIRDGFCVTKGFKIADIDPRISEVKNCFSVSDKARSIGGGVLEAILHLKEVAKFG